MFAETLSNRKGPVTFIAAVFFLSGVTGLVYQVAWQRLLTVNYGVGTVSISVIVSVYMFGLGIGSLLGGRLAGRSRDPFALYAVIEAGLAIAGFGSVPIILALGRLSSHVSTPVSFLCLAAFLCVPTILMGITCLCSRRFSRASTEISVTALPTSIS